MDDDMQDLPIDIQVGKLVSWLVSRQHCNSNWAENTRTVREKINAAIQDMPEHPEILKLLSGSYINYFHCLKIVDILKETEADSKNILGWYTSQRMKDWQGVVKSYEKGGAGLAESGQLLHQYVAYEIPAIKNQIERCVQIQQECDKKVENAHKVSTNALNAYLKHCSKMGIHGNDVKGEIFGMLKDLPKDVDDIGKSFSSLNVAVQHYLDFISFTCEGKFQDSLSMLRYLIEHGNVTTYEYKHNEAPLSVEDPLSSIIDKQSKVTDAPAGIDFGDGGGEIDFGDGDGGGIDFGDGSGEIDFGDGNAEIDFGDSGNDTAGGIDFGDGGDDIDWGAVDPTSCGITLEESGTAGGVAKGREALTLLLNPSLRNKIIDDLYELEGFLQQRALEVSAASNSSVVFNMFDEAPKSLQMVSEKEVTQQLSEVQSIVASLSTTKMIELFLISDSPRYVDRLTSNLQTMKEKSQLNQPLIDKITSKKEESIKEEQSLQKQLVQLKTQSKALCSQIQSKISEKYNGRPVNIMGVMKNL